MSNLLAHIMEQVKAEYKDDGKEHTWDEFGQETERRMQELLKKEWSVGFKDRGLGHGDYAVIIKTDGDEIPLVVVECGNFPAVAEHIVEAHNAFIENQNE